MTTRSNTTIVGWVQSLLFASVALASCTSDNFDPTDVPPTQNAFAIVGEPAAKAVDILIPADSELAESRGVAYRLDYWSDGTWSPEWLLAREPIPWSKWSDPDSSLAIGGEESFGVGPDAVVLPDLGDGWYRICSGEHFDTDLSCATFLIQQ